MDYQASAVFISTPKGHNHFEKLYLTGQVNGEYEGKLVYDENFKSWKFTSYDNPFIKEEENRGKRGSLWGGDNYLTRTACVHILNLVVG